MAALTAPSTSAGEASPAFAVMSLLRPAGVVVNRLAPRPWAWLLPFG